MIDPIEPFRNLCEPVRDVGYEIITSSLRSKCRLFLAKSGRELISPGPPSVFMMMGKVCACQNSL